MSATHSTFGAVGPELPLDEVVGDPDTGHRGSSCARA